jgi:hypothetical protein
MQSAARFWSLLLAGTFVIAGCGPGPDAFGKNPIGPHLTPSEVVRIAQRTIKQEGGNLSDSKEPVAHYEYTQHDGTWSVLCYGSIYGVSDSRFWVIVEDRTGMSHLMRGD